VVQSLDPFVLIGMTVFLLNSLLALGYYLPLIATLFTFQEPEPQRISLSPWMAVPLFALGGLIVAIGLYPNPWLNRILNIGTYFLIVE